MVIGAEKPIIEWNSTDSSYPTVNAGIVTSLSSSFFEDYNVHIQNIVEEAITNIELDDYCTESGLGAVLTYHLCVSNQKTLSYSIDKENSYMSIEADQNSLKLRVSGMSINFSFDFEAGTEPESWLKEEGKGDFQISGSDIELLLSMTNKNGVLQVDFSDVKVTMAEYDVSLAGSSDISRGIEILFKNFKNFVKKELTNVLAWRLAKSVELSLNGVLSRGGEIIDVSAANNNNYWNMTLLSDPVFTPDFVSFVLDGSFHSSNSIQKKEKTQEFPIMPLFVGDPSETKVQFFISEMALNMAMVTLYEN